jgi:hypothetical protein
MPHTRHTRHSHVDSANNTTIKSQALRNTCGGEYEPLLPLLPKYSIACGTRSVAVENPFVAPNRLDRHTFASTTTKSPALERINNDHSPVTRTSSPPSTSRTGISHEKSRPRTATDVPASFPNKCLRHQTTLPSL